MSLYPIERLGARQPVARIKVFHIGNLFCVCYTAHTFTHLLFMQPHTSQDTGGEHGPACHCTPARSSSQRLFIMGMVQGVLVLCTIGFFVLLGVVMKGGGLAFAGNALAGRDGAAPTVVPEVAAEDPTPVPTVAPPVDEKTDHIRGGKNAKVTLVEFSDFECPFCQRFYPTLKAMEEKFGDQIRVVYKHFPLSFHPNARPLAIASECAGEQGKFWEFHDEIFASANADSSDASLTAVAQKIGVSSTTLLTCVKSGKYDARVTEQMNQGGASGVQGTPHTIVIGPNGELAPISGAQPANVVESVIQQMLDA